MNDREFHGPVDTLILEFPATSAGTETARALGDLIVHGTIRLYDLMVVNKGADGTCVEVDLAAASDGRLDGLSAFAGARSGLLGTDDLGAMADILEPDTLAVALVYENAWAIPFVAAARGEGAEFVAGARLTAQQVMDALDAVETTV